MLRNGSVTIVAGATSERLRTLAVALALVLVPALRAAPASAVSRVISGTSAARCRPAGSHTLRSTPTLRVFRTHTYGHGEGASDSVVACWLASGRQTVLVTESPHDENNDVRLLSLELAPGSVNVIGVSSSTVGVGLVETDSLESVNVRTGRTLAGNEAELQKCEEGCRLRVFDFVVTPSGALAFISADNPGSGFASATGLYTQAPHGVPQLLEQGAPPSEAQPGVPTITSLRYASGVVSWNSNGSPMSSPLP